MSAFARRSPAPPLLSIVFFVATCAAAAQETTPAPPVPAAQAAASAASAAPCSTPEHRRFDFWEGTWAVHNRARPDRPPATNRLTLTDGGCVLREVYTSGAYTGTSLSFYDARDGVWRQTWIDSQGQPLHLEGGWRNGAMVMEQRRSGTIDRLTWTPLDDGNVTQVWTRSEDGGESWTTVFDGLYVPAGE